MAIQLFTNILLEAEPTDPEHVPNIDWVERFVLGKIKAPVRLVSTGNLAGTYAHPDLELGTPGHLRIDGELVAANDRVLLVGQTDRRHNGVYTVEDPGNGGPAELKRAEDFDESSKIYSGVAVSVREGAHANTTWRLVSDPPITLDTTQLHFIPVAPIAAASKYAADITGNAVLTSFPITHNLGSTDVSVTMRNNADDGVVWTSWVPTNANTVTVSFDTAPTAAQSFRVVVQG